MLCGGDAPSLAQFKIQNSKFKISPLETLIARQSLHERVGVASPLDLHNSHLHLPISLSPHLPSPTGLAGFPARFGAISEGTASIGLSTERFASYVIHL
jgi:hypothetical protein